MQIYEITGFKTGISKDGVNFLQPSDSFQNIKDGFVFRQVLQSRKGFKRFSVDALLDSTRIMGIFEHVVNYTDVELLAITKDFLYKYNEGTDTFDVIPMAGAAPVAGFGITNNEDYVSGTTYPFANGSNRFVFTGKGMANTYMYDGTDVKVFTDVADNITFQQPAASIGNLTNAHYVIWFGERLNLFNPTTNGQSNPQGMLYSAIRNAAGNGDKFNTSGAGLLNADTYQTINGASIVGDRIFVNFTRSSWTIEKTRDNFNPYFIRRVPSELGTDAGFSFVNWESFNISIGKTGIIATDGNSTRRIDTKIPAFTEDDMDSPEIQLTYSGFDRTTNQLLFSYKSIFTEELTQDRVLAYNYVENTWSIFRQRFSCFGQTDKGQSLIWDDIYKSDDSKASWDRWDTTEEIWKKLGLTASVQKTLAGDDKGYIYQLDQDNDDYFFPVLAPGITQAVQAELSIGYHAFEIGDKVVVESAEGMTEINNFDPENPSNPFTPWFVTAVTALTVSINCDSTTFDAWTTGGTISKVISFEAELIPFNPFRSEGRKVYISHIEFLLNTNDGYLTVDVFQDDEYENSEDEDGNGAAFIKDVIIKPTNTVKKKEWVSMSVNNEADFMTFRLKQASPSLHVEVYSIRIHCKPGGLSSG